MMITNAAHSSQRLPGLCRNVVVMAHWTGSAV
jgi:hypothetical protein